MASGWKIGIHTYAVDAALLDPPYRVLDEIALQMRIALIEVGHLLDKPAVGGTLAVEIGGIGVIESRQAMVGHHKRVGEIEPVAARRIGHPPMVGATVIKNHVHHHLDAALVA